MLDAIFRHIDKVYDLELNVDITDYLVTADTCSLLGHDTRHASVLVREGARRDALELGVYLGKDALRVLSEIDLTRTLRAESFEVFMTAIEEVSHFAYLVFSASLKRHVTQLELELQAEVDKFITATFLVASRNQGRVPRNLLDRLFDDFETRKSLDFDTRERYTAAASLASRYCAHVVRASMARESLSELLPELRSFYRLTQRGKIGRIFNAVYAA